MRLRALVVMCLIGIGFTSEAQEAQQNSKAFSADRQITLEQSEERLRAYRANADGENNKVVQAHIEKLLGSQANRDRLQRTAIGKFLLISEYHSTSAAEGNKSERLKKQGLKVMELWLEKVYIPLNGQVGEGGKKVIMDIMTTPNLGGDVERALIGAEKLLESVIDIKDESKTSRELRGDTQEPAPKKAPPRPVRPSRRSTSNVA